MLRRRILPLLIAVTSTWGLASATMAEEYSFTVSAVEADSSASRGFFIYMTAAPDGLAGCDLSRVFVAPDDFADDPAFVDRAFSIAMAARMSGEPVTVDVALPPIGGFCVSPILRF